MKEKERKRYCVLDRNDRQRDLLKCERENDSVCVCVRERERKKKKKKEKKCM